jgi:hypothetical protein
MNYMSSHKFDISNKRTKRTLFGVILGVISVLTIATVNISPQLAAVAGDYGSTIYPASIRAVSNSCGDIFAFEPDENFFGEIPAEFLDPENVKSDIPISTHPMIVPVYGYMSPAPLAKTDIHFYPAEGFMEIPYATILRTMYDLDTAVIYYDSGVPAGDLIAVQQYALENPNTLVVPWTFEDSLPLKRELAYAVWGISQTCGTWDEDVFTEFRLFTEENTVSRPSPAPAAKLTDDGYLQIITPAPRKPGLISKR